MIWLATVVVLVIAGLCVGAEAQDTEKYTSRYDGINIDDVLSNERLFKRYLQCLLDEEDHHCTPDGKLLKQVLPEAITTNCSKCSDGQYNRTHSVIRHLIVNRPDDWVKLGDKYDPEREFIHQFETLYGSNNTESSTQSGTQTDTGTTAASEAARHGAAAMNAAAAVNAASILEEETPEVTGVESS